MFIDYTHSMYLSMIMTNEYCFCKYKSINYPKNQYRNYYSDQILLTVRIEHI